MKLCLKKIVSGGNVGSEQAALSGAFLKGYETGGFIPKGYRTEYGYNKALNLFNLSEMKDNESMFTSMEENIDKADGTILFINDYLHYTEKEQMAKDIANRVNSPLMIMNLSAFLSTKNAMDFLLKNKIETLNITGGVDEQGSKKHFDNVLYFTKALLEEVTKRARVDAEKLLKQDAEKEIDKNFKG